jgi:hypothetical protein
VPEIPEAAIAAATAAIRDQFRSDLDRPGAPEADALARAALEAAEPVTEHAHQMSGGGYHVWNTEPYIEKVYPLAQRIEHGQRFGGKVYRRRVIVVEDWAEVAPVTPEGEEPPEVQDECRASKMDDGSHSADYEDSGCCAWCGEAAENVSAHSAATGEDGGS